MQNNISMSTGNNLFFIIFSMVFLLVLSVQDCVSTYLKGSGNVNRSVWHCLGRRVLVLGAALAHDRMFGLLCPPCWCLAFPLSQGTPSLREGGLKPGSVRLLPSYIVYDIFLSTESKIPPHQNCSSCLTKMLQSIWNARQGNNISCQQCC